jgi:hypothetical protein
MLWSVDLLNSNHTEEQAEIGKNKKGENSA